MKTDVYKKTMYSSSKKTRITSYLFDNKYGNVVFSKNEQGNFRGFISEKSWSKINWGEIPENIIQEWENCSLSDEEYCEEQFQIFAEAKAERKRKEEELKSFSLLSESDFDKVFSRAVEGWDNIFVQNSDIPETYMFCGVKFTEKYASDGWDDFKSIKISNEPSGFVFVFKQDPSLDKERVKFVWDVCLAGEKIPNKGIVSAFAKKTNIPSFETLLKNGIKISNDEYKEMDIHSLESISYIFSKYDK